MTEHFDARETRDPVARERDLLERLPGLLGAAVKMPGWRAHLGNINPAQINSRAALAQLPVLRKGELPAMQKATPPFAGLVPDSLLAFGRLFTSPGPIYEPEGRHDDAWRAARGLFAAGFRLGDVVLNTFSYHLTPGGFILDAGARAVGCAVIPAGPGNTEQQLDVIEHHAVASDHAPVVGQGDGTAEGRPLLLRGSRRKAQDVDRLALLVNDARTGQRELARADQHEPQPGIAEQAVEVLRAQTTELEGVGRINDSGVRILHSARALRKTAVGK